MSSVDGGSTTEDAPAAETEAEVVDELREGLAASLRSELGDGVIEIHIDPGRELWARVSIDAWVGAGTYARDDLHCNFFEFLSAIDWMPSPFGRDMDSQEDIASQAPDDPTVHGATEKAPDAPTTGYAGGDTRFQLLARLHSPAEGYGMVLKADLGDDAADLHAPSWVPLFAGAEWHEREAWEMFGIVFDDHPHLRHLYLPGEFEGHPLRKDFPLLARRVKPWPGIVDVEPMPGQEDDGDAEAAEGDSTDAAEGGDE